MFDIIIIGGGPAGSILAKEAAKNFSVAMIYEDSKKPCGGLLSDDAQRFFAERTMALPKELLVDPQIFEVDTIDVGQNLWRRYQRSYINIDRKKFDAWLRSFVPENVVKIENHASKIVRMEDRFAVSYNETAKKRPFTANILSAQTVQIRSFAGHFSRIKIYGITFLFSKVLRMQKTLRSMPAFSIKKRPTAVRGS